MAVGAKTEEDGTVSVRVQGGVIDMVDDFIYFGSSLSGDGEISTEVYGRIGKASQAFGRLRESIFQNNTLSISSKRMVYRAVVLSVLLYGAETWAIKANMLRRLDVFHNRCVRSILGVSRYQQWRERLTTKQLSAQFGMQWSIGDCILDQRLRWLGHLGRMDDDRLPKKLLFGELLKKRPFHGVKKRWRDVVMSDLHDTGIGVD